MGILESHPVQAKVPAGEHGGVWSGDGPGWFGWDSGYTVEKGTLQLGVMGTEAQLGQPHNPLLGHSPDPVLSAPDGEMVQCSLLLEETLAPASRYTGLDEVTLQDTHQAGPQSWLWSTPVGATAQPILRSGRWCSGRCTSPSRDMPKPPQTTPGSSPHPLMENQAWSQAG